MPMGFPAGHVRFLGYLQFRVRFVELHPGEPPPSESSIQTLEAEISGDIQTGYHKLPKWSLFEIENIEKLNGYHGRMITCVGIFVDSNH